MINNSPSAQSSDEVIAKNLLKAVRLDQFQDSCKVVNTLLTSLTQIPNEKIGEALLLADQQNRSPMVTVIVNFVLNTIKQKSYYSRALLSLFPKELGAVVLKYQYPEDFIESLLLILDPEFANKVGLSQKNIEEAILAGQIQAEMERQESAPQIAQAATTPLYQMRQRRAKTKGYVEESIRALEKSMSSLRLAQNRC